MKNQHSTQHTAHTSVLANRQSDVIANVLYHEFAHSSHYSKVGNTFWFNYVSYVILNGGYGNASTTGSERIEVSEGWADYVGYEFAHARYGLQHSDMNNRTNTWQVRIENFAAKPVSGNFPFDAGGTMFDMTENGEPFFTLIRDEVQTYTMNEIFNALQPNVTSVQDFHQVVLAQNLNKEILAVNFLFSDYGF
ncbi:MAG: hypothetical protein HQ463_02210 [Bacteroidetes bacterium]|nr:hypothetical protein [Bacteroidota bacterium]